MSGEDLVAALLRCAPALSNTQLMMAPSASSGIVEAATGRVLKDQGGHRIYFEVLDGTDIPRIFEILHIRSWLAGFGRIDVSVSGAMLNRGLADLAMRNPVQPDFASPAVLGPGLRYDRPASRLIGHGGPLDSKKAFPDLTEQEVVMYQSLVEAEKKKAEPTAAAKREEWLVKRKANLAAVILARRGKSLLDTKASVEAHDDANNALINALDRSLLTADFGLVAADGKKVSVEEILANVARYEGQYFLDPLEPDYNGGSAVARVFQKGDNVFLHSFAHGGKRYRLERRKVAHARSRGKHRLAR